MRDDLPKPAPGEHWWIALVTFEHAGDVLNVLSPNAHGAVGWFGGLARNEDELVDRLRASLLEIGLKLVGIEKEQIVRSIADIRDFDDDLAGNVEVFERGKYVVWGSLHAYLADGEG